MEIFGSRKHVPLGKELHVVPPASQHLNADVGVGIGGIEAGPSSLACGDSFNL